MSKKQKRMNRGMMHRAADAAANRASTKVVQRLKEIRERGTQYRDVDVGAVDVESRTVDLSFSSETEKVERWFGIEILGHDNDEVDLSRLNNSAPLLWMHDWDDQRGVIEPGSVRIDGDKKGRATVRISRSPEGEKLLQDIVDRIVTKVSVGYTTNGLKLVEERDDGTDVYRVTSWQPFEISMVSIAADDDVGVGRKLENPQEESRAESEKIAPSGESADQKIIVQTRTETIMDKVLRDSTGNLVRAKVDGDGKIVEVLEVIERAGEAQAIATRAGAEAERARVRELTELGKAYGQTDRAMQFISEGKTAEEFRRVLLDDYARARTDNKPLGDVKDANIGLTDKEVRSFSIMKAIRAMADPSDAAARKDAAFEIECSRAAAERYGKSPKGIIIPNDVLVSRAFGQGGGGSSGGGQNLVQTTLLSGSFIELLRHKAWVMKRARTLSGLVGNVDIPRQSDKTQAYWVGEATAPTSGQPAIDQVAFTPKTVGAYTDITRRLMKQATPDAEAIVRDDLLKIMALEIDRAAIYGSGSSNQPLGLNNITGINAVAFGSNGGSAGNPSFAELVQMETDVALADADVGNMSYSFNAAIRGHCKTTLKFPGVNGSQTIWEQGNTVNGYETNVSNQIASGDVFFGNWMDLVIAMWGGLELMVDPYSLSTTGGLRLVALQDVDINVRHNVSFTVGR